MPDLGKKTFKGPELKYNLRVVNFKETEKLGDKEYYRKGPDLPVLLSQNLNISGR